MIGHAERELPNPSLDTQSKHTNNKKLPHGVAPETYELLLFARDHKEILDKVDDLDKGKTIINPTRNLMGIYYGTEASLRDLAKATGGNRTANAKRRILNGLVTIWQNLPTELQLLYPKEKAIKLKENISTSPRIFEKRSQAIKNLWGNEEYREKNISALRSEVAKEKKRRSLQQNWIMRKTVQRFLQEELDIEINRRTQDAKKAYRDVMHVAGSSVYNAIYFLNTLREKPAELVPDRPILERDIKAIHEAIKNNIRNIFSTTSSSLAEKVHMLSEAIEASKVRLSTRRRNEIEMKIGIDEETSWKYVRDNNLFAKILETGVITEEKLRMIGDYFDRRIIRAGLTLTVFDRFTIAVAKSL